MLWASLAWWRRAPETSISTRAFQPSAGKLSRLSTRRSSACTSRCKMRLTIAKAWGKLQKIVITCLHFNEQMSNIFSVGCRICVWPIRTPSPRLTPWAFLCLQSGQGSWVETCCTTRQSPSAQSPEPDWSYSAIRKLHVIICLYLIDQKINMLLIYSCGESPYAEGRPVTYSDL